MSSNASKGDADKRAESKDETGISNGLNARPLHDSIGQSEQGLPDDSSKPVDISPKEEARIAEKLKQRP
jgi:hypothetical protein